MGYYFWEHRFPLSRHIYASRHVFSCCCDVQSFWHVVDDGLRHHHQSMRSSEMSGVGVGMASRLSASSTDSSDSDTSASDTSEWNCCVGLTSGVDSSNLNSRLRRRWIVQLAANILCIESLARVSSVLLWKAAWLRECRVKMLVYLIVWLIGLNC